MMRFGNPNAIGKYPGAVNLLDIASKWENRSEAKRALHFVASFYEVVRCLSGGHGMPRHEWLLHLAYRKFVSDIAASRLTGKLRTHVGSVIHAIYADELGEVSMSASRRRSWHGRKSRGEVKMGETMVRCQYCPTMLTGGVDTFGDHRNPCCARCWYGDGKRSEVETVGTSHEPLKLGVEGSIPSLRIDGL